MAKRATPHPSMASEPLWRTKDNRDVPISEMEESHLDNAIAMMERKIPSLILYEMAMRLETYPDPSWIKIDEYAGRWRMLLQLREERAKRVEQIKQLNEIISNWDHKDTD